MVELIGLLSLDGEKFLITNQVIRTVSCSIPTLTRRSIPSHPATFSTTSLDGHPGGYSQMTPIVQAGVQLRALFGPELSKVETYLENCTDCSALLLHFTLRHIA